MKKLCFLIFVLPLLIMAQDDSSNIVNLTHIEVKMGHEAQSGDCINEPGWKDVGEYV